MEEIWADILGYEGKYQVSTEGNVRSLNYNNTHKIQNLKIKINHLGYREVKLSKNNKTKDFMVARLVAQAFIPNPKKCELVTHKDNNKLNDNVNNLKWVYTSEAKYLMYKNGNRKIGKASKYKITFKNKRYKKYSEIAKDYNMKPSQLMSRLNKGWSINEATEIKVDHKNCGGKPYYYKYYESFMTLKQISNITGVSAKLINKRLNNGWNIYEAAEIMKGERR